MTTRLKYDMTVEPKHDVSLRNKVDLMDGRSLRSRVLIISTYFESTEGGVLDWVFPLLGVLVLAMCLSLVSYFLIFLFGICLDDKNLI